jgi:predicted nucleotidyltransferase
LTSPQLSLGSTTIVEGSSKLGQNRGMDKDGVVQTLRAHELELKAAGIVHLRLFGSVARGEASPYSDVDLMVELDGSKKFSLLDMSSLENRLSDILQVKVDLALSKAMKEPIRRSAEREAVLAF